MTGTELLLLSCLHQDPSRLHQIDLASLGEADWHALWTLAARHRVRPSVYQRLAACGGSRVVPRALWSRLGADCRQVAVRNLRLFAELARLGRAFANDDIPVIALKGAHVAVTLYADIALREIGDLDLLVKREDLHRATAVLLADGYSSRKALDVDLDAAVSPHISVLVKPASPPVELHWNLAEPGQLYSIDPIDLWARAQPIAPPHGQCLGLSSEDLLLHLCVHLAYQHRFEFGLRSLCDLTALVARDHASLRWDVVAERAATWRWSRGVQLSLQLAHELLGLSLPGHLHRLRAPHLPPGDVLDTAAQQILVGFDPQNFLVRELAVLENRGWRVRSVQVCRRILLPPPLLRHEYPELTRSRWGWCLVHLIRTRDLLRRHGGRVLRRWVWREKEIGCRALRQHKIATWLLPNHDD